MNNELKLPEPVAGISPLRAESYNIHGFSHEASLVSGFNENEEQAKNENNYEHPAKSFTNLEKFSPYHEGDMLQDETWRLYTEYMWSSQTDLHGMEQNTDQLNVPKVTELCNDERQPEKCHTNEDVLTFLTNQKQRKEMRRAARVYKKGDKKRCKTKNTTVEKEFLGHEAVFNDEKCENPPNANWGLDLNYSVDDFNSKILTEIPANKRELVQNVFPDAFTIWAKKYRLLVAEEFPGADDVTINKKLEEIWQQLPIRFQAKYHAKAEEYMKKYAKESRKAGRPLKPKALRYDAQELVVSEESDDGCINYANVGYNNALRESMTYNSPDKYMKQRLTKKKFRNAKEENETAAGYLQDIIINQFDEPSLTEQLQMEDTFEYMLHDTNFDVSELDSYLSGEHSFLDDSGLLGDTVADEATIDVDSLREKKDRRNQRERERRLKRKEEQRRRIEEEELGCVNNYERLEEEVDFKRESDVNITYVKKENVNETNDDVNERDKNCGAGDSKNDSCTETRNDVTNCFDVIPCKKSSNQYRAVHSTAIRNSSRKSSSKYKK